MTNFDNFREQLMEIISKNPGLHFRELQRRTGSAVGKLDYHLYQMEREGRIYSRKEGSNIRYFSNESGTVSERKIAYFMRIKEGKEILVGALSDKNYALSTKISEKQKRILIEMVNEGIIRTTEDGNRLIVTLTDRASLIRFLKKYGQSFIDSIALSILNFIDEF